MLCFDGLITTMALKPIEIILRAKDEASSVFEGLRSRAATIGVAIAGYFGFTAFAEAVKGAADLEAMLSEVQSVTSATADDMVRLRTAAEDAGATTKYTATQAAEALGNLARAGLNANQAIEALPATLQLAQAGGVDLGRAAEFITKSVMGMGDSFDQAGRYADVLAKGANASNTSVTGLAEALSYAAPTAATLKLSLEDTVAIIGKFADAGIDASRAGTALNSILSQFSDPASAFKKALADIGITTTNFNGALAELAASGARGQKAIAAVGLEAGPALKALLNQGIGALDELRNKLKDASGSAAETAAIMGNNLRGSMNGLASAWDTVKNSLATPVLPVLKSAADSLTAALSDAVKSGTVTRWGEAIKAGFESAITWGRAFAAQVDFEKMGQTMRVYADRVGEAFTAIQTYATNAGNIVQAVWGTMSAGTNVVLGTIYKLGEVFAIVVRGMQNDLALLMVGLSKVTFGAAAESFRQAAQSIRESADATGASARALGEQSAASFAAVVDGAQMARNGWAGLTSASSNAQTTMQAGQAVIAQTAQDLQLMADKARETGNETKLAAAKQAEAAGLAADKVKELRATYEGAVASGNWQLAAEKLVELKQGADRSTSSFVQLRDEWEKAVLAGNWDLATQKLVEVKKAAEDAKTGIANLEKEAKDKAAKIADAFSGFGVKTKKELTEAADLSIKRFEVMKSSGEATADVLATAWKKMAEDVIAANGGVATDVIQAQSAMYGYKVELDAAGKSTLVLASATDRASTSQGGLTNAINDTTSALERQNAELDRTISAQEKELELKQRAIDLENRRRGVDREGFRIDKNGNREVQQLQSQRSVYDNAKGQGLSEADALALAKRFVSDSGELTGAASADSSRGESWATELQKAIDAAVLANAAKAAQAAARQPAANPATQAQQNAGAAKTYNVTFGGRTVKTASDADAQALMQMLNDARLSA